MGTARCASVCPVALNCARHDLSGTLASLWPHPRTDHVPLGCLHQLPNGNDDLSISLSIVKFLNNLVGQLSEPSGYGDDWEEAYNVRSKAIAGQLRVLTAAVTEPNLVRHFTQTAEFFATPVVDPEMGTRDQGDNAALRDFCLAAIISIRGHSDFVDFYNVLDALFSKVTQSD